MARHDWTAIVTDPAQEYLAQSELARFGLQSYLPQIKKRWVATHNGRLLMRRYPLFPRYILLPLTEIRTASIYACRGLRNYHPVLADAESKRPGEAANVHERPSPKPPADDATRKDPT